MCSRPHTKHRIFILALLLWVSALPVFGAGKPAPAISDTPAGKRFGAWLRAFNTGEAGETERFAREHWKYEKPEFIQEEFARSRFLFARTHGLRLRKVTAVPGGIQAFAQSRLSELWYEIKAYVEPEEPHRLHGFFLDSVDPPAEFTPKQALTDEQIRGKLDALVRRLAGADVFSGAVLLARGERPIYTRACGWASRAWKAPNRIDTRFSLASITKMFTATAVMQLAEQGKLSYEDPVGKLLPDYPNAEIARKVTVHQLLSHTAGLPGASGPAEYEKLKAASRQNFRRVGEYLPYFGPVALQSEPGTRFEYSNYGYILLGAIVERVSGQDYYDYIRTHVFTPAGMTATDFYELDTDPPNVATGYMDAPDGSRRSNRFSIPVKGESAGGAYSTVGDMLKFSVALRAHRLVSAPSLERAWTAVPAGEERSSAYGYGTEISRAGGLRIVGHGGGWFGITNRFEIYPDRGYTLVVLGNVDFETGHITQKVSEWLRQGHTP